MPIKFRCALTSAIRKAQKLANESRRVVIIQAECDKSLQIYFKESRYLYGTPIAEVTPEKKLIDTETEDTGTEFIAFQ